MGILYRFFNWMSGRSFAETYLEELIETKYTLEDIKERLEQTNKQHEETLTKLDKIYDFIRHPHHRHH